MLLNPLLFLIITIAIVAAIIEHLPYARHCANCFSNMMSFNPHIGFYDCQVTQETGVSVHAAGTGQGWEGNLMVFNDGS